MLHRGWPVCYRCKPLSHFAHNLRAFGVSRSLEMNQWTALHILSLSSQSERAKNSIHCFGIYWRELLPSKKYIGLPVFNSFLYIWKLNMANLLTFRRICLVFRSSIASIQSQPKMMIPRIAIHRSSSPIGLSQFNPDQSEPVTTKPSVETHEEQKGAIRALRKWVNQKK